MEWISLDDRLPEFDVRVLLLFDKCNHIEDGTIHEDEYGDGWVYCLFDGQTINDYPSHWMPLPEAPKE